MTSQPRPKKARLKKPPLSEQRLKALLENPSVDLKWYYQLGKLVAAIAPSHQAAVHYGHAKIETLVDRYGKLRPGLSNLLHGARHFATVYRRADLPRLRELSWSHVARLASIDDAKKRQGLERRCLANNWTVSQLQFHCLEALGRRSGGRTTAKPIEDVGPVSTLSETIRLTDAWLQSYERRIEPDDSSLKRAVRSKHRPELRALVSKAIEGITRLQGAVEQSRKKLQKLSKEIERGR